MVKASVTTGYARHGLADYKYLSTGEVTGADVEARDGLGNVIKVSVRDGEIGYRISLNGKDIAEGSTAPRG